MNAEPEDTTAPGPAERRRWLTAPVAGIGVASLLSDLGHEVPTSLLPTFLNSTLGAPAAALGVIEGFADGIAGAAKLAGGALADDPGRRRTVAVGGYTTTAITSSLIGAAVAVWQVAVLRVVAWAARGIRNPSRNALLADATSPEAYGRAFGFERGMDNLGAIGGPLLALLLVALLSVRTAILLSIIPGLGAAVAIFYAARHIPRKDSGERRRVRLVVRPLLKGSMGHLLLGVSAFEAGNIAATLMILRSNQLLGTTHPSGKGPVVVSLGLYTVYNVVATVTSMLAGHASDRAGAPWVLRAGVATFAVSYLVFALTGPNAWLLAAAFVLSGIGIGCVETGEHAAVAAVAPERIRGSAFGLLAASQSFGNLAASGVAGILWTVFSAKVAFLYITAWMLVSLVTLPGRLRPIEG